jgi:hypothetical protein
MEWLLTTTLQRHDTTGRPNSQLPSGTDSHLLGALREVSISLSDL